MEHPFSGRAARLDLFGQALEADALLFQLANLTAERFSFSTYSGNGLLKDARCNSAAVFALSIAMAC